MSVPAIVAAVLGLVVVTGYVGWHWLRGRVPSPDDSSVLAGAPPPEMTAATAVIVEDGPTGQAFLAALLDLASRDEIRFRDEGRADERAAVGIEIRGGDSDDARVVLNRRRPIGEAEAFLLTQLQEAPLLAHLSSDPMAALAQAMGGLEQYAAFVSSPDAVADDPAERARRSHGLFAGQSATPADLVANLETRLGHPLPPAVRASYAAVGTLSKAVAHGSAAAGPGANAAPPPTPEGESEPGADPVPGSPPVAESAQAGVAASTGPAATYISAPQALHLPAPLLFRTVAETYARRHGWIAELSLRSRWRWRAVAALELALAALLYLGGGGTLDSVAGGLALGIATGALITLFLAPLVRSVTKAGALMRAQLAAYRRTLQMTIGQAHALGDVAGAAGLSWLETPDQAIVWAVALGLQGELEALLGRGAASPPTESDSSLNDFAWYRHADAGPTGTDSDVRAMFAGIEAIGSQPRSLAARGS